MLKLPAFRPGQTVLAIAAFLVAGLLAALIAWGAAVVIENRSAKAITSRLLTEGFTWAHVTADGLRVILTGTAPNEAARFRAVNLTGSLVEASRIVDAFDVTPARSVAPPRFSVEMLRNDDGIQLIGLLPEGEGENTLLTRAKVLTPEAELADMLETAAYPAPATWDAAFAFGLSALDLLPRSKISVAADAVGVTAIAASEQEKRHFQAELARLQPQGVIVRVEISAPRPVLTPFTLRFVSDASGQRFDACAADTEAAQARILAAARAEGVTSSLDCTIGLGVPSPSWAAAVEAGIRATAALGNATITFSDADVSLLAGDTVTQASFDRVVGELRQALPDLFSLDAKLVTKATAIAGPAEFTAARAPDTGRVELRGRLTDDRLQAAVDSYAKARFGVDAVYTATLLDPDLPDGWPTRVLAGLEALAELDSGSLLVRADTVAVTGMTGSTGARARVSQILSDKLGQGKTFSVDVTYVEALDPLAALPTPQECAAAVEEVLLQGKITFTPGSAEIDAATAGLMTKLAEALTDCRAVPMEIAGHTDAQGSDTGNRALSQARAEAVMVALQGRQVDVSAMRAVGYGEGVPIADNGNEAGREANRRIEFKLIAAERGAQAAPLPDSARALPEQRSQAPDPQPPADDIRPAGADPTPDVVPDAGPDFSGDTSPSVAPTEKTIRPQPRPARDG